MPKLQTQVVESAMPLSNTQKELAQRNQELNTLKQNVQSTHVRHEQVIDSYHKVTRVLQEENASTRDTRKCCRDEVRLQQKDSIVILENSIFCTKLISNTYNINQIYQLECQIKEKENMIQALLA